MQPIAECAAITRERGVPLHTECGAVRGQDSDPGGRARREPAQHRRAREIDTAITWVAELLGAD
jgi:hypothetical protein